MAGPGYTVSYSPWINPYTGTSTAGQAYYSTASQQQAVRRLAPPAPPYAFRYPGVSYSYGNRESEEEEESGTIASRRPNSSLNIDVDDGGAPLMSGALPEAPEPPSTSEVTASGTEDQPTPVEQTPAEAPPAESGPAASADEALPASDGPNPVDTAAAEVEDEPSKPVEVTTGKEPAPPVEDVSIEEAPISQEE